MSQPPPPAPGSEPDELQFDTAEAADNPDEAAPAAVACAGCGRPITDLYYAAGEKVVCPDCRDQYVASQAAGPGAAGLVKATVLGIIGGTVGALIWFAVGWATGYTIGLIAIVVGLLVGGAVRAGSGGRGGREYQILAVLLTYLSICLADLLAILPQLPSGIPVAQQVRLLIRLFPHALTAPFSGGQNIIGILIIAFAIWQAWQMNTGRPRDLAGPYSVSGSMGAPPPPAATPGVT